jgi:hypothetical protein
VFGGHSAQHVVESVDASDYVGEACGDNGVVDVGEHLAVAESRNRDSEGAFSFRNRTAEADGVSGSVD